MVDKKHIETVLKINGLADTAPDEEIRSVLLSARFNNDEVDAALMVLRQNITTNKTRVDGLHKVFRTDQGLDAKEISNLLGIDVTITHDIETAPLHTQKYSLFQVFVLWFASMVIALTAILYYMYMNDVGLFHPTGALVKLK